jgi:hypothetical protein
MLKLLYNLYIIVNRSYLLHFWTILHALGLVLNLTGMVMRTRTRTRSYPYQLPAGVPIPLTFTNCRRFQFLEEPAEYDIQPLLLSYLLELLVGMMESVMDE